MREIEPIIVVDLFPQERKHLLELFSDFTEEDWEKPTVCPGWTVKDIGLHLLGDDLGYLAGKRDHFSNPFFTDKEMHNWEGLVKNINEANELWVKAIRRISPRLLFLTRSQSLHEINQEDTPMLGADEVEISHEGLVAIIKINRPHVRNAINKSTAQALKEAWLAFEANENAYVGILTGGDEVFCAGADLRDIDGLSTDIEGEAGPLGFTRLFVSKPTIAAVAGYCVAGGLELACWCDMRIADETAIFGCFERRFGVPLVDGGTQRLPHIIGLGRALELILTGRPVSAQEALAIGLTNEVVPRGQSLRRAIELGQALSKFPQNALRNDRRAVYGGLGKELAEGLRLEALLGAETIRSGEPLAGSQHFKSGKGRKGTFE